MSKVSLNELMGKSGGQSSTISLKDLPELLGEKMQEMPRNQVGKFRLLRALKERFGNGFRNIPGVRDIMKEFDDDIQFESQVQRMKRIKVEKKNG